ncbi:MAG: DUF389 domain-containing protein [Chitinophagaceae bacterium]|jgi:uncharacterized hydrophobic protein (TIGR00271 family)|nr:DUF389 domain-containing protein [Chitinophagaceae bacterium]
MAPTKNKAGFIRLIKYLRYKFRLPNDRDNIQQTIELVRAGAIMTGPNLWVLVVAIFTASLGLNVNSTAVIIGAMLISPLMGPIMAMGMGGAITDFDLVLKSLKNFGIAVVLSIVTSTVYFIISPLKVPGSELLARTSPTIYDVLIAIFGGLAGIIAGSGKLRQSNVIPGVAIATALMPPLCTVGFGIANLNPTYIFGAFYLFFINTVFISLSTFLIVRFLRYPHLKILQAKRAAQLRRAIGFLVLITIIPSIYFTWRIVNRYIFEERVKQFVAAEFQGQRRVVLKTETVFGDANPEIQLSLLGPEMDSAEMMALNASLKNYKLEHARLSLAQGLGGVTKGGQVLGSISSAIDNNRDALRELYKELSELEAKVTMAEKRDSLQAITGMAIRAEFANLQWLRLEPFQLFDAVQGKNRQGWQVDVKFGKAVASANLGRLQLITDSILRADTIKLNLIE